MGCKQSSEPEPLSLDQLENAKKEICEKIFQLTANKIIEKLIKIQKENPFGNRWTITVKNEINIPQKYKPHYVKNTFIRFDFKKYLNNQLTKYNLVTKDDIYYYSNYGSSLVSKISVIIGIDTPPEYKEN